MNTPSFNHSRFRLTVEIRKPPIYNSLSDHIIINVFLFPLSAAKYRHGRCFIRPSGTEDVIRVYAEAATQEETDSLANSVAKLVDQFLGFGSSQ